MALLLERSFHHRRALVATVALGVLLGLSALRVGFFTDDYTFLAFLETPGPKHPSTFDLYDFVYGRADTAALMSRGFPWFMDPDLKLRFFRPISSALFILDHAAFGHAPLGYHVHSLLWFGLSRRRCCRHSSDRARRPCRPAPRRRPGSASRSDRRGDVGALQLDVARRGTSSLRGRIQESALTDFGRRRRKEDHCVLRL